MRLEHERNCGLGMDALGHRMLLEHARNYGLGMDALGHRMLLEHERNCGLGMAALGHRMLLEHGGSGMDALGHRALCGRSESAVRRTQANAVGLRRKRIFCTLTTRRYLYNKALLWNRPQ